jgi:uncharacterized DUF497 family protein
VPDLPSALEQAEGFEWDEGNLFKSWERHRVRFSEAEEVFVSNRPLVAAPARTEGGEERFAALGRTDAGRLLSVVSALRGRLIRVVSARDASRKERKEYVRARQTEADPQVP